MKPIHPWERLADRQIADCRVFTVHEKTMRPPDGAAGHPFFVLSPRDWVNVIPLTPEGEVVLIEQFRHGTETVTLEIPGGMVDPEDASPIVAARRELIEETGYDAEDYLILGVNHPNPAIQDNRCTTILARNALKTSATAFDTHEDIAVRLVPRTDLDRLVADGSITHALVIVAFHWLSLYERGHLKS